MTERERTRPQRIRTAGPPPEADDGGGPGDAAVRIGRLLGAADDAIARALSGDSERFLQATRQSGGQ